MRLRFNLSLVHTRGVLLSETQWMNINNPYFEGMVNQIYPPKLQLNKANSSDTEVHFLYFTSISKICDKRDDVDFDIVFFFYFGW